MTIGVLTTFYGYRGGVVNKVKSLIAVFQSLNLRPFIQLHSQSGGTFGEIVSELSKLKDEFDVKYSVHQSMWLPYEDFYVNLGSSDAEVWRKSLKSIEKSIDFAKAIEAENVSFHAGYAANHVQQKSEFDLLTPVGEIPYETAYSNVRRGLEELLDYANGNVHLSVENLCYRPERRYLFSLPEDFEHLVEGVNVLFDIGHAYYSEKMLNDTMYIEKMTEMIGGRITEMHVSDNNGSEDEHKLIGYGHIPFLKIFNQISKFQRMPPTIIEASKRKHLYSEEDLKNSINILRKILSEVST
jgi:sugar phosphate isomerase/epimerase